MDKHINMEKYSKFCKLKSNPQKFLVLRTFYLAAFQFQPNLNSFVADCLNIGNYAYVS